MPGTYQYEHELRHLIYFHAVARHLHFRNAAAALHVAQPALSRQIAQLEAALGVRLFERTRRRVELTAAGRALQERVEPILQSLQRLPAELQAIARGERGRIRVGYTGLAMATVLPAIIREFSEQNPGVRIELAESPTAAQLDALRAGALDCGFFHPGPAAAPGLRVRELLHERNGVLLPAGHRLAAAAKLRLRDLADVPFILFPRDLNPGFYDRILATCARAGVTLRIVEEIWPRANAVGLVRAGIGATFITPSEAHTLPADIAFRPLAGPAPESRLVVGWSHPHEPSAAVAAFLRAAGA